MPFSKLWTVLIIVGVGLAWLIPGELAATEPATSADSAISQEAPPAPRVFHLHDGEKLLFPDGRYALLKVTPEATGSADLLLGSEILPPGTAIPVHSHEGYGEILMVHDGDAVFTLGDKTERARPGSVMYVPPGTWHGVANPEGEQTTIFFVFPDADMAEFFRTVGLSEGETPAPLTGEDWERILTKHRMRARPPAE